MDNLFENLDWALIQAFVAVAETGSLSAAARQTGHSQPTLGRQIKLIEAALGSSLFTRQPRGLQLNDVGAKILPMAQEMREAYRKFSLIAAGQSQSLKGVVRITASVLFSHYTLPPIIAHIRQQEPKIDIELAPSDTTENLLFREADIAIRMYRPTQEDLIARKLGELKTALFASNDYLARRGEPKSFEDMPNHDFVGFDRETLIIDGMKALGIPATRSDFSVRCDQQAIYWELVRAGCGIGIAQLKLGRGDQNMTQVLPQIPMANLPVWLAAPEALRITPRIRRVYDLLAEAIMPICDA
ncbi:MAG: LysR family transcriptional regulator [Rhodobacteraceae bacterium]|nr:LysR family transcriptional regulator [Paracoccaceae bacterium]